MTGRSQGGIGRTRPASGENAAADDRFMNAPVMLQAGATPSAPALVLRPWRMEDVAALVEVSRDPALRQWASSVVDNDADGARWVQAQQRSWAAGDRFGFAVFEAQPGSPHGQLVGNVVLKEVTSGKPAAEVGYWTAAHARGRGVAPALWRFSPAGPSTPSGPPGCNVSNSFIRRTISRRAALPRRAGTSSAESCPPRRPPSLSMATYTYGAWTSEVHSAPADRLRPPIDGMCRAQMNPVQCSEGKSKNASSSSSSSTSRLTTLEYFAPH